MADKLERMQALAGVAKQFGGDPESEMRNRLLEAQIQAGREQTAAMRHQTQGGMMKSMMDMQKMQGDLQLNPLRREALGAEIAASNQRTAASQAANVRAGELHRESVLGQQEINEGRRTANAQLILQGEERVRKSVLEEKKLKGELGAQASTMTEWNLNEDLRENQRETALQVDAAKRRGIPASQIGALLSQVGPSLPNLPPAWREIVGTALQEGDPFRRTPDTEPPFSKRIGGPMTSPTEDAQGSLAAAQELMWIREALASEFSGLTLKEKKESQGRMRELLKQGLKKQKAKLDADSAMRKTRQ